MNYMTKFNQDGTRFTSVPCDIDMTDELKERLIKGGYIEISEEEWEYYVGAKGMGDNGTGYIRGADGKPTSAPPYVPTATEKANEIANAYTSQVDELDRQIVLAMADGDNELVAELKEEKETALTEYKKKLEEIQNG